mgnify:CR=1 FL=1
MKEALVVIDMQNDFIDGSLGTAEAQKIVSKVISKIKAFSGDLYYTRDTHTQAYLDTLEGKHLPVVHCVKNTFGWEIQKEVWEAGSNKNPTVIDKATFGSTELAQLLSQKQYTCITLIGLCTDICVISNALNIKSFLWETPIVVDASCCAGVTPESHTQALNAMKICQIEVLN